MVNLFCIHKNLWSRIIYIGLDGKTLKNVVFQDICETLRSIDKTSILNKREEEAYLKFYAIIKKEVILLEPFEQLRNKKKIKKTSVVYIKKDNNIKNLEKHDEV